MMRRNGTIGKDVEDEEYGDLLHLFNPVTTIKYSVPKRSHVKIDVYNILGRRIQTLVDGDESAGSHFITWDGTTVSGQPVATGVYLYRFQTEEHVETKKMLLIK